jgi:uncharacterized phage protein (TIGR02220 family)
MSFIETTKNGLTFYINTDHIVAVAKVNGVYHIETTTLKQYEISENIGVGLIDVVSFGRKIEPLYEKEMVDIITDFNVITGKRFKTVPVVDDTRKKLLRLLKEGYRREQFASVVNYFYNEWIDDSKMKQYITPATLFNLKFDTRLETVENRDSHTYQEEIKVT